MKIRITRKTVLKYLTVFIVGAAIFTAIVFSRGILSATETKEVLKIVCDGFAFAGLLLALGALLVIVANGGAFHGITFALKCAIGAMIPGHRRTGETYYDYKERKKADGKKDFGYILLVGLFYVALSLIVLYFYYKA